MTQKILVIDDEAEIMRLLKLRLTKAGYDVLGAAHGLDALKLMESQVPDLILLDIKMPKMDGWSFLRQLKKDERLKGVPVLVLSAFSEMRDLFTSEGVQGYIIKPFDSEKMLEQIQRCLRETQK